MQKKKKVNIGSLAIGNHNDFEKFKTEMELKQSLIKAKNAIRRKYKDLHEEKIDIGERSSLKYKPIIDPIKMLIENKKKDSVKSDEQHKTPFTFSNEKDDFQTAFKSVFPAYRRRLFTATSKQSPLQHPTSSSKHSLLSPSIFTPDVSGVFSVGTPGAENTGEAENVEENIIQHAKNIDVQNKDQIYGLRQQHNGLYLGKEKVSVKSIDSKLKYCIRKKEFTVTPGLTDLLLTNQPKYYNHEDLNTYKQMLVYTSAHKKDFKRSGAIRRPKSSLKYHHVIKDLFPKSVKKTTTIHKGMLRKANAAAAAATATAANYEDDDGDDDDDDMQGTGLKKPQTMYKTFDKFGAFNYTYWDNPNELVNRLRLLVASQAAGHTGHNNEVISIIEELREAKFIM